MDLIYLGIDQFDLQPTERQGGMASLFSSGQWRSQAPLE